MRDLKELLKLSKADRTDQEQEAVNLFKKEQFAKLYPVTEETVKVDVPLPGGKTMSIAQTIYRTEAYGGFACSTRLECIDWIKARRAEEKVEKKAGEAAMTNEEKRHKRYQSILSAMSELFELGAGVNTFEALTVYCDGYIGRAKDRAEFEAKQAEQDAATDPATDPATEKTA